MPWVAAAIGGSAIIGGATSLMGAKTAADASKNAANLQQQQYQTTRGDLLPYNQTGQNALQGAYNLASGSPTGGGPNYIDLAYNKFLPGQMTQAELEQTPGYQFDLAQGLKATQSGAAARGLGVSGASLKGAGTYATGLANKTYLDQLNVQQQRFSDVLNLNTGQQSNLQNQFNRYNTLATLGENAAAQTGQAGTSAAATAGNYINQAGLASAAGLQGVGNALTGGVNNYLGYQAYTNALNPTTTGYNPTNGPTTNANNAGASYF